MKFNCGTPLTPNQKFDHACAKYLVWHKWFAWYPVRVGPNDCRWLEVVYRQYDRVSSWDNKPREPKYQARRNTTYS